MNHFLVSFLISLIIGVFYISKINMIMPSYVQILLSIIVCGYLFPPQDWPKLTLIDRCLAGTRYIFDDKFPDSSIVSGVVHIVKPIDRNTFIAKLKSLDCYKDSKLNSIVKFNSLYDTRLIPVSIDYNYHVLSQSVENETELKDQIQKYFDTDLDQSRPLWQQCLVNTKKGRSAWLMRCSHIIGDGLRIANVLQQFLTFEDGLTPARVELFDKMRVRKKANAVWAVLLGFINVFRFIQDLLFVLAEGHFKADDKLSMTTPGEMFENKSFVFESQEYDFRKIKKIKDHQKQTVNDVLYSIFCETIKKQNMKTNPSDAKTNLNAHSIIAFGLPSAYDPKNPMFNCFTVNPTPMVFEDDLEKNMQKSKSIFDWLKGSNKPFVVLMLVQIATQFGLDGLIKDTTYKMQSKRSFLQSNVPMFSRDVQLLGESKVLSFQAQFKNVINQCILTTYKDTLQVNLTTSKLKMKDYKLFLNIFGEILEEYQNIVSKNTEKFD